MRMTRKKHMIQRLCACALVLTTLLCLTACGSGSKSGGQDMPPEPPKAAQQYAIVGEAVGNLIPVRNQESDCWTFLDARSGKVLLESAFMTYLSAADGERIFILLGQRVGRDQYLYHQLVDAQTAKIVCDDKEGGYDGFGIPGCGLIPVCKNDFWGYIDYLTGEQKIDFYYNGAEPFVNGVAAVTSGERVGMIDTGANYLIPSQYQKIMQYDGYLFAAGESFCEIWTLDGQPMFTEDNIRKAGAFIDTTSRLYYYKDRGFVIMYDHSGYSLDLIMLDPQGNILFTTDSEDYLPLQLSNENFIRNMSKPDKPRQLDLLRYPVMRNGAFCLLVEDVLGWEIQNEGLTRLLDWDGMLTPCFWQARSIGDKTLAVSRDMAFEFNRTGSFQVISADTGEVLGSMSLENWEGGKTSLPDERYMFGDLVVRRNGSKSYVIRSFTDLELEISGTDYSLYPVRDGAVYPDMGISRLMGEFELETYTPEDFDPYVSRPALVFTQRDSGLKGLFYDSKLVYPADYQDIIWGEDGFTLVRGATETLVTWAELDELAG